jgi:uroporphyrinogen-III decarboxylase
MLLFERMHSLCGMVNVLTDLYADPGRMAYLADRIVEHDLKVIANVGRRFPGRIYGFSFSDDWGTELATFVSPKMWCEFFQPRYARIFDAAHAQGWTVHMHSCGKVNDIINPLIEIGLDAINLQQPRVLDIEEIGRRFAGRICFLSLCDIQHTLPFKGAEEIREEARLLLECWGTPEGGFILSDYGDGEAIGVAPEKKQIMLDAFLEADRWARARA